MNATSVLFEEQKSKLEKAIAHLDYSFKKVKTLSADPEKLDEESLAVWESFVARFNLKDRVR